MRAKDPAVAPNPESSTPNPQLFMRIGIFGGSFDPIHNGHLLVASEACEALGLEQVLFITTARPTHKTPTAPPEARHEMTVLATADDERLVASRLELDRPGPSYTVDTLEQIHREFAGGREQRAEGSSSFSDLLELFFITGADAYNDVGSWHQAERLTELAQLVAVTRPGYAYRMDPFFSSRVQTVEIPGLEISSSMIRSRLQEGRSIRYLVPRSVEEYIVKHRLYP